ncbi:MAG: lipopolysaccharide assembly protein LapA domain-containing protein [Candidatus Endonucleobacter bathymodioli]|uniref:Lipopolysaccharide assembly protein LapA domain-containing protein n=1 Tax=Candidatus Endonucleibacter bathymodioli TaxID=539814 RepID=A0AA90STX5_9GAMM|nr:lipopolysaccharide assembly protein LapA domain-containing protein [Candidatus Endonucleobacter bathymodioli]
MTTTLMVWIKRIFVAFLLLLMLILLVNFTASNAGEVQLKLFSWHIISLKISALAISSFVFGGVAGLIVAASSIIRLQLKNSCLKRKIDRRNTKLQKLRSSTLKGLTDV